jgi:hypothetical protein
MTIFKSDDGKMARFVNDERPTYYIDAQSFGGTIMITGAITTQPTSVPVKLSVEEAWQLIDVLGTAIKEANRTKDFTTDERLRLAWSEGWPAENQVNDKHEAHFGKNVFRV